MFLAHGKTVASHQKFSEMKSDASDYEIYHSPGGFADEEAILHYLDIVHAWVKREPCALILDRYVSHQTDKVKQKAAALEIKLIYIPTSATDVYQPLDRRVFGVLKSKGSMIFNSFVYGNSRGYTYSEAADAFIKCWKSLSKDLIHKAWNLDNVFDETSEDVTSDDFMPASSSDDENDITDVTPDELDDDDILLIQENKQDEKRENARLTPPRKII